MSNSLELDRTTVQKSLRKLLEREIIERRQNNLDKGGYIFFYCIKKKNEVKEKMHNILRDWHASASVEINNQFSE